MRDAHRLIIGEVNAQTSGDLLRTPRLSPAAVLPRPVTPPAPADLRTRDAPVRALHFSGEAVLHIAPQLRVDRELGRLRPLGAPVGMRLRGRGPILRPAAAECRVTLQLSGDRRRRTTQLTRDLPDPTTPCEQDRDLLPLDERQITPRHRRKIERRHPATLAEPPDTNARQHTRLDRSLLARCPPSDRLPEPDPMLPPPRRRMPTPTRPSRSRTTPRPVPPRHSNSSSSGVATTN